MGRSALDLVFGLSTGSYVPKEERTPEQFVEGINKIIEIRPDDPRTGQPFTFTSEVNQLFGREPDPLTPKPTWIESNLTPIFQAIAPAAANFIVPGSGSLINTGLKATQEKKPIAQRRTTMGFFDDIFGGSDSSEAVFAPSSSGTSWLDLLNTAGNVATSFFGSQSQGVPYNMGSSLAVVPRTIGAMVPAIRGAAGALSAKLSSIGLNRSTAITLLKQQGPAALIALGLTAYEVGQLARSSRRRRMNMCNGRALRRASRRLEAFHKFYKRTCGQSVRQSRKYRSCK